MTSTSLTVNINNTSYPIVDGSFVLPDKIEQISTCSFTVFDANNSYIFLNGQIVTATDTLEGLLFYGSIQNVTRHTDIGTVTYHEIQCTDRVRVVDSLISSSQYVNQYAGAIVVDQVKNLWPLGILANYAVDTSSTLADFTTGNLNGVVASLNVGDGDLELAAAGAVTVVAENSTSIFSSGTLNGVASSANTLAPTATATLKIVGTESLVSDGNAYTYIQIFAGGSIGIITGRYLAYDIWLAPTCPQMEAGVDIIFTDGTTLRDATQTWPYNDAQNIPPHPNHNLAGFADGRWYHRKFLLDNFNGKTISHVDVAIEGDNGGTYTVYIKNILEVDVNDAVVNTFFGGTLNVNPPKQMQNSGYSNISCTIVNTYDCATANRVSPAYSVDQTKIAQSGFISWKAITPTNTNILIEYSLDGGNSYIACTNNAVLPNYLAGLSIAGKTITFRQTFQQLAGTSPESKPILASMICTLNPSYAASKSDVTVSATTTSEWNTGTTLTNTTAPAGILSLFGGVRDWSTANLTNMTIFGGGASGPSNTTVSQHCNYKNLWIQVGIGLEGRSQLNWLGQWQNAIAETDIYADVTYGKPGIVYRTTGWSNYDANYAYAVEVTPTSVALQRGSNSSAASTGTRTQVATATLAITANSWHKLKVIFNGSNHQVWLDDIQYINATDSTYTGSGYVGLRASNSSATVGYQGQFNNFGLSVVTLTGTWLSSSTSLTAASTYLNSVVTWQDASINNQSTTILVESTINGGTSFQTVTNGGPIPNLTLAQSLSGISVQFRITLTTASAASMPQVQYFKCYVLGGFSSSGTRISKALSLSGVGTCGSTLVSWNAITPTNTSVVVATSLDGITYTNVASGGAISGINQQPSPTLDSFNLLNSGNYTSTFGNGGSIGSWTWDTVNSRITITGGSLALLLYGAINTSDVDVLCDMDRADIGGLVFRCSNTNNYYALVANDSLSSNTPNKLVLERMSAGTRTFPTQGNITFIRGDNHRIRVTIVGGLITAYFDGVQIFQYTDGSPLAGGQCGLAHDTGTSQFYNLRIQPFGDNLTGKNVYTKVTLTSTDPTVTPQVTDITTLVTNPNIGVGSLIPTANYVNTYRSDNIKGIATQSSYYWNIKADGSFVFIPRQTVPAPWPVTTKDTIGAKVQYLADLYRNRHIVTGVQSTIFTNELHIGDANSTSWALKYNVVSMSSITLNGQAKAFGLKGTTGKNFYYQVGSNTLAQDTSGTILVSTDQLVITYTGQTTTTVIRDNTGQFPLTTSQKAYRNQCGLSAPVQVLLNQASAAQTVNGNSNDLDVSLCRVIILDINITAVSGTSPVIQFFIERKDANGNYNIIYQPASINTVSVLPQTIGPLGSTKESLGSTIRLRWTITGTTPSFTFSASIVGKVDVGLANIGVVEAVEDVSSQNIDVTTAQNLGDSRLQQYGLIGRTVTFVTKRTGLACGQYVSVFIPSLGINDAQMLITSADRSQRFKMDTGSPSQSYFFNITATEGPSLGDWEKALNQIL